jgi:hypothetical protein
MARRWILTAVLASVLLVGTIVAARAIREDDTTVTARVTNTTSATSTTTAASTAPTTTTTAPSTTVAPATTSAPTSTAGPPGPCGAATAPIRAAIDAGVAGAGPNADLSSCRLAASDPTWAAVNLSAKPGAPFAAVTVILHGPGGAWSIVAQGGPSAGCGQAPQQVIVDLGQFCAGTGGGAR